ncbi:hypothetical protein F4810DRAFT_651688 [Camillea tinctor]|nr:hypothetical protein F4810DRAFT_651688 [Camillea tinctor]
MVSVCLLMYIQVLTVPPYVMFISGEMEYRINVLVVSTLGVCTLYLSVYLFNLFTYALTY